MSKQVQLRPTALAPDLVLDLHLLKTVLLLQERMGQVQDHLLDRPTVQEVKQ